MLRLEGLLCTYNHRGTRQYIHETLRTTTFGTRSTPLRRAFAVIYSYGGGFVSLDAGLPN